MDTITKELLQQDKEWLQQKLDKAHLDAEEKTREILRFEGAINYAAQLIQFLDKPEEAPKEE